jgi:hypothetical protein
MSREAKVKIRLSEDGQKDALARGLPAEREQEIAVQVENGDIKYFSVDSKGALSLNLIYCASLERRYDNWRDQEWSVYPSAGDVLNFLRERAAKRAEIEARERADKEEKEAAEKASREGAYQKFCALSETEQEEKLLYDTQVVVDGQTLYSTQFPAVAAAAERRAKRRAADKERATRLNKIPRAPRADRGVKLAADGQFEFAVPSGSYEKSWAKHVTSVDGSKRGGYAIEGPWLTCSDTLRRSAGEMIAVGSKEWRGSRKRGGFETELNLYVVTPAGLIFDRQNNETTRAADLLSLTAEERVQQALTAEAEHAQSKIDALLALDRAEFMEEISVIDERLAAWREKKSAIERALVGVDAESNIVDIDSAAAAIVAAGYRELAKRHHPDAGGSTEAMALINAAKKQLVEILNAAKEVK